MESEYFLPCIYPVSIDEFTRTHDSNRDALKKLISAMQTENPVVLELIMDQFPSQAPPVFEEIMWANGAIAAYGTIRHVYQKNNKKIPEITEATRRACERDIKRYGDESIIEKIRQENFDILNHPLLRPSKEHLELLAHLLAPHGTAFIPVDYAKNTQDSIPGLITVYALFHRQEQTKELQELFSLQ